jgi:hypothetical protein
MVLVSCRRTALPPKEATMKRRLHRLGFAAAMVVVVAAAATGAALADQSYTDPTGDAGGGADITGVAASNTTDGIVSVQTSLAGPLPSGHAVSLEIDSDKNPATGPGGTDHVVIIGPALIGFFDWNGSDFVPGTPPTGFGASGLTTTAVTIRFNRSAYANLTGFSFSVSTISVEGDSLKFWDSAPDAGTFTYDLAFPQCSNGKDDDGDGKMDAEDLGCSGTTDDNEADDPVNIKVGKAKVTPARPKAGRTVVVSAPTTRVETSQALDTATVKCSAKIVGGAALRGTGSLVAGRATCKFKVPATAKNKTVRGKIAVTYQTASASTPFTFKTAA